MRWSFTMVSERLCTVEKIEDYTSELFCSAYVVQRRGVFVSYIVNTVGRKEGYTSLKPEEKAPGKIRLVATVFKEQRQKAKMLLKEYDKKLATVSPLMHFIASCAKRVQDGDSAVKGIELGMRKENIVPIHVMEEIQSEVGSLLDNMHSQSNRKIIHASIAIILSLAMLIPAVVEATRGKTDIISIMLYVCATIVTIALFMGALFLLPHLFKHIWMERKMRLLLSKNSLRDFKRVLSMLHFNHQLGDKVFYDIKAVCAKDGKILDAVFLSTASREANDDHSRLVNDV